MTMRETLRDEEARLRAPADGPTDGATFQLHRQFMQAHGAPRGELTTLVTSLAKGGVFLSGIERAK